MSAYGGYTKTSYGAQGGEDSGGFFPGGSQQGSQSGNKVERDESLRPVTIKQIIDADEAYSGGDFKIDGLAATQVTFVGQVRSVNPQSLTITFKLDDGTGQVEVKKWINPEKQEDASYELDSYVRVWGRFKSFENKRQITASCIRPITDFNEVNYHLLEAAYVHLLYTKGSLGENGPAAANGEGSMFVDGSGGYNNMAGGNAFQLPSTLSPLAKKMFNWMRTAPGAQDGLHNNFICSSTNMSLRDVVEAAEELKDSGLIYPIDDDQTWAVMEYAS